MKMTAKHQCPYAIIFLPLTFFLEMPAFVSSQDLSGALAALMSNLANLQTSELRLIIENKTTIDLSETSLVHNVFEGNFLPLQLEDVRSTESFPKPKCQDNLLAKPESSSDNRKSKVFFVTVHDLKSLQAVINNFLLTVINCPYKQDGGYLKNENIIAFFGVPQEKAKELVFHAYETQRHPHIALFNKLSANSELLMSRYDVHTKSIISSSIFRKGVQEYQSLRHMFPWLDMKGYKLQVSSIPYSYVSYGDMVKAPSDPTKAYTNFSGYYVSTLYYFWNYVFEDHMCACMGSFRLPFKIK